MKKRRKPFDFHTVPIQQCLRHYHGTQFLPCSEGTGGRTFPALLYRPLLVEPRDWAHDSLVNTQFHTKTYFAGRPQIFGSDTNAHLVQYTRLNFISSMVVRLDDCKPMGRRSQASTVI